MSRLVKPEGVGKTRDRLARSVILALRELAAHNKPDAQARDLVAYMSLALDEIDKTIEETCSAWEKRDYWIKADQFRTQWAWTRSLSIRLARVAQEEHWIDLPRLMPELADKLGSVTLPKRNGLGQPWVGAYARLLERRPQSPPVSTPEAMPVLSSWRPRPKKTASG